MMLTLDLVLGGMIFAAAGGGGYVYVPSLDFSLPQNSQYIAAIFI